VIADAVVIGSGPNGLVAAIDLADRGWDVVVLEAAGEPGGAVRSAEVVEPGFTTDLFSAFYPLGIVSPHLRRLGLEAEGLEWRHAPAVLAHPTPDGPAAVLSRDPAVTAASLERFAPGDGARWLELQAEWDAIEADVVAALMQPFPPVRAAARLVASLGLRGTGELARRAVLPVRRFGEEQFAGAGGPLLVTGAALHSDLSPGDAASALFGWLLTAIGQRHGWPVPRTGAGALSGALVRRLARAGGRIRCDARVDRIEVSDGCAVAVHLDGGDRVEARRAVIADVVAPQLYGELLDADVLPSSLRRDMRRYQPGSATFKVDWTLDRPIPWDDPAVAGAGTVHLARSLDELVITSAELSTGHLPDRPFILLGQMTVADPSRSPTGTETVWAYTNVPQHVRGDVAGEIEGLTRDADVRRFADRLEGRIEEFAPGFRSAVRARRIQAPSSFERDDANLLNGDKSLGTAQIHQQLIFRPTLGLGRPETPIRRLFLASASAHPGGGVHGACGANAARAAVLHDRLPAAGRASRSVLDLGRRLR
jgi:phytoene dehydrogenase-like protein